VEHEEGVLSADLIRTVPLAQRNERSLDMGKGAGSIPARNTKEIKWETLNKC
jgi:hypothetical protein